MALLAMALLAMATLAIALLAMALYFLWLYLRPHLAAEVRYTCYVCSSTKLSVCLFVWLALLATAPLAMALFAMALYLLWLYLRPHLAAEVRYTATSMAIPAAAPRCGGAPHCY